MSRTLPPLNALRAFDAAGRHQSFSLAAQELGVSHSAISRHVRGLEHRLGIQLFRERPRGVALTSDGQSYLDRIAPALDVIATATEGLRETPEGRITVNAEPLFATKVLIPHLGEFHAAYPGVEVRLEASRMLADVERYEADLAIRGSDRDTLDVPSDLISDAPLFPYAAPDLFGQGFADPADLIPMPRLRDRSADTWQLWFRAAGVSDPPVSDMRWRLHANLAFEAALFGHGIFLASAECVARDEEAGRLRRCFDVGIRRGGYHLVYGSRGPRGKAARVFRSWLMDTTQGFRGQPLTG